MTKFRAKSIADLKEKLLRLPDAVSVFSFDIFDTILGRRIDPPEHIHQVLAAEIADKLQGRFSQDQILSIRYEEERILREKALKEGLDFECHYDDILRQMLRRIRGIDSPQPEEWIKQKELSLEIDALVVKNGVVEMLSDLKAAGYKIIVISDMYLGKREISALLQAKGLLEFICEVFVSSETFRCKYSGRMFEDVLHELDISPEQMVHTGDNWISDFKAPLSKGIHAIHLKEPEELKRRAILKKYLALGGKQDYWKGRHLLQVAHCTHENRTQEINDFYFQYGFGILGPIFCLYIQEALDRILQEDIRNVYFLARDGFLFQELYHKMAPEIWGDKIKNIKDIYLCLSRQSTASAAVWRGMSHEQSVLALYNPKQQGLKSILKSYALREDEFIELAKRHGLQKLNEPITDWNDPRLLSFLEDHHVQEKIKKHGEKKRKLLAKYLAQNGFFSASKAAFVDIGWNGTIQYCMGQAFSDRRDYPKVFGLYFGYCMGIPYSFSEKDIVDGLFYDERRRFATERSVISFEEVFEESCRACHATTTGYSQIEDGAVQPEFKPAHSPDRKVEILCDPIIKKIQEGILSFSDEYLKAIRLTRYGFRELKPFMLTLAERAVVYPRKDEVNNLTRLVHTEDWGHDNVMDLTEVKNTNFWRDIKNSIHKSDWRYGTLTQKVGSWAIGVFRMLDILRRV